MGRPFKSYQEHSQTAREQMISLVKASKNGVTWGQLLTIIKSHPLSKLGRGLLVFRAGIVKGENDRYYLAAQSAPTQPVVKHTAKPSPEFQAKLDAAKTEIATLLSKSRNASLTGDQLKQIMDRHGLALHSYDLLVLSASLVEGEDGDYRIWKQNENKKI